MVIGKRLKNALSVSARIYRNRGSNLLGILEALATLGGGALREAWAFCARLFCFGGVFLIEVCFTGAIAGVRVFLTDFFLRFCFTVAPHLLQNLALLRKSAPHCVQCAIANMPLGRKLMSQSLTNTLTLNFS